MIQVTPGLRAALRVVCVAFAMLAGSIRMPLAQEPVELELVLAVDASSSVNRAEFDLQMTGLADAFRAPAVRRAVEALGGDGIAVALLQWSSSDRQTLAVPWTRVRDDASALAFADSVAAAPRYVVSGGTAIGEAVQAALGVLATNGFAGRRRVIDVSGDGRANMGLRPALARDAAAAAGVTVNGLAILNEESGLDRYYLDRVIGGTGAFLTTATDYGDFAEAIVRKLVREIAGAPIVRREPSPPGAPAATAHAATAGSPRGDPALAFAGGLRYVGGARPARACVPIV